MAGFMTLQVWQENGVVIIDPDDPSNEYSIPESHHHDQEAIGLVEDSWWAQYSANGYMDCTDTVSAETAVDAARECFEIFGNDEDKADRDELAAVLWQARKVKV